jgi:hypothetical protein
VIVAIYARKSTEQTGISDLEKSVARQVAHGKTYADRKGWMVSENHIFVDDGTGMARCAHCGGPMTIVGQDYHRRKGRFYGCAYYKTRGSSICNNSLLVEQDVLDRVLLKSIADVLTEQMLKVAVDKALAQMRAGQGAKLDRRTAVERELSLIGTKKEHLVDAIAEGNKDPAIRERLNVEETRRQELIVEQEQLCSAEDLSDLNEARLKRDLKSRIADTQALLSRQMTTARRLLKTLID